MMTGSPWEMSRVDKADDLAFQLRSCGHMDFEREFAFDPKRKWRIDIAFCQKKIAIEVQGGVFSGGRHVRGAGYAADCERACALAIAGWRYMPVTSQQVRQGIALQWIEAALNSKS